METVHRPMLSVRPLVAEVITAGLLQMSQAVFLLPLEKPKYRNKKLFMETPIFQKTSEISLKHFCEAQ